MLTKIPKFRRCVIQSFPFIEEDFDALTDYELLCKVVEYLNKVITSQNEVVETTEGLLDAFSELQSYVATYFDNLDVQEEINNKLDQMAEDGTLQEIIGEYLNATAVWGFDTVADMIASTNLINGSYARTLGYNTKNDRGGAVYKIRTITNDDVVDGGAIIEMDDNSLIAELVWQDSITPEQYGCYGDGVHDDTAQFKKLLTFITDKTLPLIGEGIYLLSEAITIGNINIVMPFAKILTNYGITINGATDKTLNLPQVISNTTNANYAGITMFECYTNQVTVNYIEGFTKGLYLTSTAHGCVYNTVNIVEIKNCLNGIVLEGQNNGWVNQNLFIGGRVWSDSTYTTTYGADIIRISLLGTSTHIINNNMFINTCIEGDEGTSNGLKIKLRYATTNKFESVRFEGANAKVDALNSTENILSNGYNVTGISFVNDAVATQIEGVAYHFPKAGRVGGVLNDIQVGTNTYPIIQGKNSSGQLCSKLLFDGLEAINATSGNPVIKISPNGISGYDLSNNAFVMIRGYAGHTNLTNADGTNHCVVIAPGGNTNNGAFLWVYDGHLYGKMGSKPNNQTDGTVIL